MAFPTFLTSASSLLRSFTLSDRPRSSPSPRLPFDGPAVADVLATKAILLQLSLPLELIDAIIDYAEYWPHTSTPSVLNVVVREPFNPNYFVARTLPLGCLPSSPSVDLTVSPAPISSGVHTPYPFPSTQSEASKTATEALYAAWARSSRPRNAHPCRKIVFRFQSHDQGWGGDYSNKGTYRGSYTWMDVGKEKARAMENDTVKKSMERLQRGDLCDNELEKVLPWDVEAVDPPLKHDGSQESTSDEIRLDHPFLPHHKVLQKNRAATPEIEKYTIVWRWDDNIDPESTEGDALEDIGRGKETGNGEFVRNLEIGDVVTLWARARFQGWSNTVENAQIDMFWAV